MEKYEKYAHRIWYKDAQFDDESKDYHETDFFVNAGSRHSHNPKKKRKITHIVIHVTGWNAMDASGTINRFRAKENRVSTHYIIDREGVVIQMVREEHIANHIRGMWSQHNKKSIAIEHVNPNHDKNRKNPTEAQYKASARLVAYLCKKYNIPIIHSSGYKQSGILGHKEFDRKTDHNCTHPVWDWKKYMGLVRNAAKEIDITKKLHQGESEILPQAEIPKAKKTIIA